MLNEQEKSNGGHGCNANPSLPAGAQRGHVAQDAGVRPQSKKLAEGATGRRPEIRDRGWALNLTLPYPTLPWLGPVPLPCLEGLGARAVVGGRPDKEPLRDLGGPGGWQPASSITCAWLWRGLGHGAL